MSSSSRESGVVAQAMGGFSTATLYEALGKSGAMAAEIRCMLPGTRLCGVAYTVRTLGAETAAVLTAIDDAAPGAVLVIDTGTVGVSPTWGGTSSIASSLRGLAGMVTNGVVRDLDEMIETGLPVYATGRSPIGTLKNHPGWRQVPVSVGGVLVNPGDFVIGDGDGVVVVPAALGEQALERAEAQRRKETERDARIRAGERITAVVGLGK